MPALEDQHIDGGPIPGVHRSFFIPILSDPSGGAHSSMFIPGGDDPEKITKNVPLLEVIDGEGVDYVNTALQMGGVIMVEPNQGSIMHSGGFMLFQARVIPSESHGFVVISKERNNLDEFDIYNIEYCGILHAVEPTDEEDFSHAAPQ